jgi:hypothetical protein
MVSNVGRTIRERKFQERSGGNMPVMNFQRCSRPWRSNKTSGSMAALLQLSMKARTKKAVKR